MLRVLGRCMCTFESVIVCEEAALKDESAKAAVVVNNDESKAL